MGQDMGQESGLCDEMMTGDELMMFLREHMSPTTYYQPLIIGELIRRGGVASQRDLAQALMLGDESEIKRWERILGRWPRATLRKRGVVAYDRASKTYRLLADPGDERMRSKLLDECARQVRRWQVSLNPRSNSKRYEALRKAAGRCQLCGMPGNLTPLHVDHIVPKDRRNKRANTVTTDDGQLMDVDDDRNLQVLCATCNTAKRATDTTDFRPSAQRLAEVIRAVRRFAAEQGIDAAELEDLAARP